MHEGVQAVPALVKQLYVIVHQLESYFPGRRFTLDGHLVGSIGEVLAAHYYGLTLHPASAKTHDARCSEGRDVQVKATQGRSVGLRCEPEHLLVLKLERDGSFLEVFNGPGNVAWTGSGAMQSNGQRPISLAKLKSLMTDVPEDMRLKRYT